MTIDVLNIRQRIKNYLPINWFKNLTTVIDIINSGCATSAKRMLDNIDFVKAQMRLSTSTGRYLDLFAQDFFGDKIRRGANESDALFRKKIEAFLFREKATRPAMSSILEYVTGYKPIIIEPWYYADWGGGYGGNGQSFGNLFYNISGMYGGNPYDTAYQVIIIVFINMKDSGIGVFGYGSDNWGLGITGKYDGNKTSIEKNYILEIIDFFKSAGIKCKVIFEYIN